MDYIVLNKKYALRNDVNCSFIVRKCIYLGSDMSNYKTIYPIPPFLGFIFSNIGKRCFPKSLSFIGEELNVTIEALQLFILQIVEKPNMSIRLHETEIILPENILAHSNKVDSNTYSMPQGFSPFNEYRLERPHAPLLVNFMLTEKCNTNCIYCYAKRNLRVEMAKSDAIEVIKELSTSGVVNLTITGGDIFARDDWYDILSASQKAGFGFLISTKTILGQDSIQKLKNLGIIQIQFSLDSTSPDTLQQMIGVSREYAEKLKMMFELCSMHDLRISLRTVLCKQNTKIEEIKKLCDFVEANHCIVGWTITPAFYSANKKDYSRYSVENRQLVEVFAYLRNRKMRVRPLFNKLGVDGYKLKRTSSVNKFVEDNQTCYANTYSLSILPSGECTVCEMLYYDEHFTLGNIKEHKLSEIWNSKKALQLYAPSRDSMAKDSACSSCLVFDKCKRNLAKKICYVDIMKVHKRWDYPDPKCPLSPMCEYIL